MFMLAVAYLRALLNWRCLFTYVDVGCCVFQALLNWCFFLFTYIDVGCCVSQGSAELVFFFFCLPILMLVVVYLRALLNWCFFFCLPILMLVVVYLRALLNWSCLFTYVYVGCCVSQGSAELEFSHNVMFDPILSVIRLRIGVPET